jgi:hypothetical protein
MFELKQPLHMKRREYRFNPEVTPLKQWPFIYNDDDQHWYIDWSELIGFLLGAAIATFVIGAIGLVFWTGLVAL